MWPEYSIPWVKRGPGHGPHRRGRYWGKIGELIREEGLPACLTSSRYISRENIKIIEENKRETEINQEGKVDQESFLKFKEELKEKLPGASLLILSGSLPGVCRWILIRNWFPWPMTIMYRLFWIVRPSL